MDLFEAYPNLRNKTRYHTLYARSLRLITVSGIVCDAPGDDGACYFALSERRYWTQQTSGEVRIGVGGVKARLFGRGKSAPSSSPLRRLTGEIRQSWRCEVAPIPYETTFLLDGDALTKLHHSSDLERTHPDRHRSMPFLLVLTPPRLGGGVEVPDALVQAVYRLQRRAPTGSPLGDIQASGLGPLRIQQQYLGPFLARDEWAVEDLLVHPWAELTSPSPALDGLNGDVYFRPVLALRGLQRLWREGLFPPDAPGKDGA
jgi:hypothetical protein